MSSAEGCFSNLAEVAAFATGQPAHPGGTGWQPKHVGKATAGTSALHARSHGRSSVLENPRSMSRMNNEYSQF